MDDGMALYEELKEIRRKMVELGRSSARGEVEDYELGTVDGPVRLSSLFGDSDDLIVIQNMGRRCPYCTLWADGLEGLRAHLESRAGVALCSPDSPEDQRAFAESRGWGFRMVSSAGGSFKKDLGFESEDGSVMPGVTVFRREGDTIRHVATDYFGPGDVYCGAWHLFDLLEGGPGDWQPRLEY